MAYDAQTKNIIMACYAVSLANGENLVCRAIRSGTIREYLRAAASWSTSANLYSPLLTASGIKSPIVENIIREQKRWESMPNRREPLTPKMLLHLHMCVDGEDSLSAALADWATMGINLGLRKSEWCQEQHEKGPGGVKRAPDATPLAMIGDDGVFYDDHNRRITGDVDSIPGIPKKLKQTFRWQKNGQNGEMKTLLRNDEEPHKCPCRAWKRILQRAKRLGVPPGHPVAVFAQKSKRNLASTFKLVVDKDVEKSLRNTARDVYNITSKKDLQRFSCHSYRVGACVQLHAAGIDPEDIKFRLRWRSDTFRDYLRDIDVVALRHLQAMEADPENAE